MFCGAMKPTKELCSIGEPKGLVLARGAVASVRSQMVALFCRPAMTVEEVITEPGLLIAMGVMGNRVIEARSHN